MSNEAVIALLKKNPISVGCGVLTLALAGGLYYRGDAIPAAEAELAQKQAEAERFATNLNYSAQLKEQLDALIAANKAIDAGIVRASQVGTNTQYFYKLESETGVKMVDFRPLAVTPPAKGSKSAFISVGFTVSVQGTFPQVLDFLRQLEAGARYTRVLTASVSGSVTNRKAPLTLTLTVELLGLP
jgi:hypothetical protein